MRNGNYEILDVQYTHAVNAFLWWARNGVKSEQVLKPGERVLQPYSWER